MKMERAVANLLSNAAKFSDEESPIVASLTLCGDRVVIAVRDEGIGIAEQDQSEVFPRFHQVDAGSTRRHGGFGIGLSLALGFVEAHGGTLTVDSAVGRGSTFVVDVPLCQPPATTG